MFAMASLMQFYRPICKVGINTGTRNGWLYMSSVCGAVKKNRIVKPSVFQWKKKLCYLSDHNGIKPISSPAIDNSEEKYDISQIFTTLNKKKERLGHLNLNDIKTAVSRLNQSVHQINDDEFLKLLHLTLNAVESEYKKCSDIVQEIWRLYDHQSDGRLSVHHTELYFQLCLLAEVPVSSEEVFKLLSNHDIRINRKLLETALVLFGRKGKIVDIQRLLAYMKEEGIALSETVFSALIYGHGFSRNMDGIVSILDTMRSLQITFTSTTYHALMTAHAICSDIQGLRNIVMQMNHAKIACSTEQLKTLITDFVKNSESSEDYEILDYIISLLTSGKDIDLSTSVLHLIHRSHVKEAIRLLSSHMPVWKNTEFYSNGRIYIQELVRANIEPDLALQMCCQIQHSGINKYALLVALEIALTREKEELSWLLLKALKDQEKPVRPHYFWPFFCCNANGSTNSSKALESVKRMIDLETPPDLETLRDIIIPCLPLEHPGSTEQMLKGTGLTVSQIATPLLIVLLRRSMVDKAIIYTQTLKVELMMKDIMASLSAAWAKSPQGAVTLLANLIQHSRKQRKISNVNEDWGGQFLLDILTSRGGLNTHQIVPLFKELRKRNILISENSADLLVARANDNIREVLKDNLHVIVNQHIGQPPKEPAFGFLPHPNEMNIEELEGHLTELKTKYFKTRGTIRRLILLHAAQNNSQRVLSLLKEIEESEEKLSPGILASVFSTFVSLKNVEASLNMYHKLRKAYPSFTVDKYKIIDLCTLLIENGVIREAVEILENGLTLDGNTNDGQKLVRRNCKNLLKTAAQASDYETTKQVFNILKSRNVILPDNLMLGSLVKSRLLSGDLSVVVQEIKDIYKKYHQLPMKIEVLIHLLNTDRSKIVSEKMDKKFEKPLSLADSLLEEVLNLIAQSSSKKGAYHDLLFACIEAGYPIEASQVLKTLGKDLNRNLLQRQCGRYTKTMREEPLLNLLIASRANPNISLEEIFKALLDIYYVQNDGNKGLSLWIRMQEENVLPSKSFLSTLATLLAANNMDIPFKVPQAV
ncbi:hypothetical protein SK128_010259 [Halocaridina rubra]|uniref:Leucine-rich PPR motif-containing protein, mitochondrial n=1 Tax=Halocaridina rubra TaxID=373956 RepID=A0AAN8ZZT3_HALRR